MAAQGASHDSGQSMDRPFPVRRGSNGSIIVQEAPRGSVGQSIDSVASDEHGVAYQAQTLTYEFLNSQDGLKDDFEIYNSKLSLRHVSGIYGMFFFCLLVGLVSFQKSMSNAMIVLLSICTAVFIGFAMHFWNHRHKGISPKYYIYIISCSIIVPTVLIQTAVILSIEAGQESFGKYVLKESTVEASLAVVMEITKLVYPNQVLYKQMLVSCTVVVLSATLVHARQILIVSVVVITLIMNAVTVAVVAKSAYIMVAETLVISFAFALCCALSIRIVYHQRHYDATAFQIERMALEKLRWDKEMQEKRDAKNVSAKSSIPNQILSEIPYVRVVNKLQELLAESKTGAVGKKIQFCLDQLLTHDILDIAEDAQVVRKAKSDANVSMWLSLYTKPHAFNLIKQVKRKSLAVARGGAMSMSARVSNINNVLLLRILKFEFDILEHFDSKEAASMNALCDVSLHTLSSLGLIDRLALPIKIMNKLVSYINQTFYYLTPGEEKGGGEGITNFFHNQLHTADVMQFIAFTTIKTGLSSYLSDMEMLALFLGALAHDYRHPSVTESFLVDSNNGLALRYHDGHITQRFALAEFFKVTQNDALNIFSVFTAGDAYALKLGIIELVLATDIKYSLEYVSKFATISHSRCFDKSLSSHRLLLAQMLIKSADVSFCARDTKVHEKWINMMFDELFQQGELEKENGLSVSPFCDKNQIDIVRASAAYLRYVAEPVLITFIEFFSGSRTPEMDLEPVKIGLASNIYYWENNRMRKSTEMDTQMSAARGPANSQSNTDSERSASPTSKRVAPGTPIPNIRRFRNHRVMSIPSIDPVMENPIARLHDGQNGGDVVDETDPSFLTVGK